MNTLYGLAVLAAFVFGSQGVKEDCWFDLCVLTDPSKYSNKLSPDVSHLQLRFCSDLGVLQFTPNLVSLRLESCDNDFHMKDLAVVANLTELALTKSHLLELSNYQFAKTINLDTLQLAGNSIERLSNGAFHKLSRLRNLHLQNNSITVLPEGVFYPLGSLHWLDLSNNNIFVLTEDTFIRNNYLRELNLKGNPLTNVAFPTGLPLLVLNSLNLSNCGQLKELRLSLNINILDLRNSGLERLQISGSIISQIIHENSKLTYADFHGAILTETELKNVLCGVQSLEWLDLSNSLIRATFFDFDTPYGNECSFPNLRFLNLSLNKLEYFPRRLPLFGPNLTTLDLSHNILTAVFLQPSAKAHPLERLHLEGNLLTSFDYLSVCNKLRNLKELALYANRFNDTFYDAMANYLANTDLHLIEKDSKIFPLELELGVIFLLNGLAWVLMIFCCSSICR